MKLIINLSLDFETHYDNFPNANVGLGLMGSDEPLIPCGKT